MRADHDQRNERHHSPSAGRAYALSGRMAVGVLIAGIALLPTLVGGVAGTPTASAAEATVNLGTAAPFSVLAGAGVTNTGPTILGGDLGTCPTPAITGFPPGVANGATHASDAVACQAQLDLTTAHNSAAGRAPTTTYSGPTDLGGLTLTTGVYKSPTSFAITGPLTLNAQGNLDAVFIFQAGSTLITATDSSVRLINGAQACNVFWQVGSSATLQVDSTFAGTVMALTSITANKQATVDGRLLASNGAVTLHTNRVSAAACATGDSSSSSSSTTDTTESDGSSSSTTDTTEPDDSSSSTTDTTEPDDSSSSTTDTTESGGGSSSTTATTGSGGGSPGSGSDGGSPEGSENGSSSTTTTQPASSTTTEQAASTSSTRSGDAINGATDTSEPATATDVLGGSVDGTGLNGPAQVATLPRTGSPIAAAVLLAGLALLLAGLALLLGVGGHPLRLATPRRRQQ